MHLVRHYGTDRTLDAFGFSNKRFDTVLEEQIAQIAEARGYDVSDAVALSGCDQRSPIEQLPEKMDEMISLLDDIVTVGIPGRK